MRAVGRGLGRRDGGRRPDAAHGQRLHPVPADAGRQGAVHGRGPGTAAGVQLHPVQQAMVECHGSQCGFCTPGFVMSMWSAYERHCERGTRPTRQQLADELSGNLCRCTGYRPILDAGQRMFELRHGAARHGSRCCRRSNRSRRARPFTTRAPQPALPGAPAHEFFAPRTADALAALYAAASARATARRLDRHRAVGQQAVQGAARADLRRRSRRAEAHRTPRRRLAVDRRRGDARRRLGARWPNVIPRCARCALRFASLPIRNAGTMGGNVANGSPIGDSAPVLLALDARVVLRRGERVRSMPLAEFYIDYMKNRLEPGEFVQAIDVPAPPRGAEVRSYKISKRFDCDISALATGFSDRARRRHGARGAARLRRHGGDREACDQRRGRDERPGVERGDAAQRASGARSATSRRSATCARAPRTA